MRVFLPFLFLPLALLSAAGLHRFQSGRSEEARLPVVESLKLPVAPESVAPATLRRPGQVDLRALLPVSPPPAIPAPAKATPVAPPLPLRAILVNGDKRMAQFGNSAYSVGEIINNYRIERIEPMRVFLVNVEDARIWRWVEMNKGY